MANTLLDLFEKNHQLLEWRDKVTLLSRQLVMGFSGSSKAVVMASALSEQVPKILIVTSTQNEAEQLTGDLSAILGEDKVYSFFTDDVVAAEFIFASPEKTHSRLESLNFLMDKESSGILVTSLVGTKLHLPNPEVYKDSRIDLTLGEEHDLEALSKHLTHIGYQRVEQVRGYGTQDGALLESTMSKLYKRFCRLVVAEDSRNEMAVDFSLFRVVFSITNMVSGAPPTADIRIYNVSDDTVSRIRQEGQKVILEAGYEESRAVIFQGDLVQRYKGTVGDKEDFRLDSILQIVARTNDKAHTYAMINTSLPAGADASRLAKRILDEYGK